MATPADRQSGTLGTAAAVNRAAGFAEPDQLVLLAKPGHTTRFQPAVGVPRARGVQRQGRCAHARYAYECPHAVAGTRARRPHRPQLPADAVHTIEQALAVSVRHTSFAARFPTATDATIDGRTAP